MHNEKSAKIIADFSLCVAIFETECKTKSAPTKVDARKMHNSVCCHTNSFTLGQVCENRACIFTKNNDKNTHLS